jgi:hypothetical protein
VQYGEEAGKLSIQMRDDRDQLTNTAESYRAHHITVRGVQASTAYYFKIGTGGGTLFDNSGQPFQVRTASAPPQVPVARTAYGTVVNEVGNPATGSILYLSVTGGAPVSALVKADGSWAVNLATMRTKDGSGLLSIDDTQEAKIQVQGEQQGLTANVTTTVGKLSPLDPITLGKTVGAAGTEATPVATTTTTDTTTTTATAAPVADTGFTDTLAPTTSTASAMGDLFTSQEASTAAPVNNVNLRFPLRDNEVINSTRPELSGQAPPNSYLQIQVHSDVALNGVAQTAADGTWQWTPPSDLPAGEHTVTVTYTDAQGHQQSIQRTFIVQANTGESSLPAFVSTPSATTVTPTPKPTIKPTATPIPTATPKPTKVPVVTPQPATTIATTSAMPVTGSGTPIIWVGAMGCLALGVFGWWRQRTQRAHVQRW